MLLLAHFLHLFVAGNLSKMATGSMVVHRWTHGVGSFNSYMANTEDRGFLTPSRPRAQDPHFASGTRHAGGNYSDPHNGMGSQWTPKNALRRSFSDNMFGRFPRYKSQPPGQYKGFSTTTGHHQPRDGFPTLLSRAEALDAVAHRGPPVRSQDVSRTSPPAPIRQLMPQLIAPQNTQREPSTPKVQEEIKSLRMQNALLERRLEALEMNGKSRSFASASRRTMSTEASARDYGSARVEPLQQK